MSNFTFILERLSSRAKNSLISAQLLSEEQKCDHIGTEHLLYGILAERSSFAAEILDKSRLQPENIKEAVIKLNLSSQTPDWKPALSENLKAAIEKAAVSASQFGYQFIGTEHFLYGLITTQGSKATDLLVKMNVHIKELEEQLLGMFSHISKFPDMAPDEDEHKKSDKKSVLEYFTIDLTDRAKNNQLTPLVGRQAELSRVISILGRKTKNNPVLIGEAGVGKTAIAEGLATAIASKQVPDDILNAKVLALDLSLLVAGSMFRGEFENRFRQMLDEIKQDPSIILFVDEMHMLVGAGGGYGSMDAANLMKPSLARGEVRMLGATTLNEYKQFIERDAALERRFQTILIEEPSRDEAVAILHGLRPSYEAYHKVKISDEAIDAAVELSSRYLNERNLPDKAVDILDETASILRLNAAPSKLLQSKHLLEKSIIEIADEKQRAVHAQDFATALHLKDQEANLKKELERTLSMFATEEKQSLADIQASDIARTISVITKIPLQRLTRASQSRLRNLEKILSSHIIGQSDALESVAKAVRRGRSGIADPSRPLASFLFAGPSGVGKTELARQLAKEVFEDDKALIRIDMSEFSEKHTVSRLIGAPPGYVGYGEGGMLTEKIKRRPYSVVLLDEIEKAHPDLSNILLQILEDGHLSDGQSKTVSFRHSIIILTSNLGSPDPSENPTQIGFSDSVRKNAKELFQENYQRLRGQVDEAAREFFRPELLNRIDEVIIFKPLGKEQIRQIVKLQLEILRNKLATQNLVLDYTPDVVKHITEASFMPAQGARKVRQVIREQLEDTVADILISANSKFTHNLQAKINDQKISIVPLTKEPIVAKTASVAFEQNK